MRRVIFDSSFLMAVAEKPTPWMEDLTRELGGFEPLVLECARSELTRLSEAGGKRGRLANLALRLSDGFGALPCGLADVDAETVSKALEAGAVVACVDNELSGTLRALHIVTVGLRKGRVYVP